MTYPLNYTRGGAPTDEELYGHTREMFVSSVQERGTYEDRNWQEAYRRNWIELYVAGVYDRTVGLRTQNANIARMGAKQMSPGGSWKQPEGRHYEREITGTRDGATDEVWREIGDGGEIAEGPPNNPDRGNLYRGQR